MVRFLYVFVAGDDEVASKKIDRHRPEEVAAKQAVQGGSPFPPSTDNLFKS